MTSKWLNDSKVLGWFIHFQTPFFRSSGIGKSGCRTEDEHPLPSLKTKHALNSDLRPWVSIEIEILSIWFFSLCADSSFIDMIMLSWLHLFQSSSLLSCCCTRRAGPVPSLFSSQSEKLYLFKLWLILILTDFVTILKAKFSKKLSFSPIKIFHSTKIPPYKGVFILVVYNDLMSTHKREWNDWMLLLIYFSLNLSGENA